MADASICAYLLSLSEKSLLFKYLNKSVFSPKSLRETV